MLDYADNAAVYWPVGDLRPRFDGSRSKDKSG
jgi:hypothetical protein